MIVLLAVLKLRVTLMTVSPRNSEAASVNLLEKTQSKIIIADTKYESLARSSASKVPGVKVMIIDPLLDIKALVQKPLNPDYNNLLNFDFSEEDANKTVLIMHSSGSTSFPKPIVMSNSFLLNVISAFNIMLDTASGGKTKMDESDVSLACVPM
jgi:acyl-coenzyme A synthetase/AMP-(fatty) acid ligase